MLKDFIVYLAGVIIACGGILVLVKLAYTMISGTNKLEKKIEKLEKEVASGHKLQSELNTRAQHRDLLNNK